MHSQRWSNSDDNADNLRRIVDADRVRPSSVFRQATLARHTRDEFERAVQLDPNHLEARYALVQFYILAPAIVGAIEDAGSGMIRVVRCIMRGGMLIPVFSAVIPAISILEDAPRFRETAKKIAFKELGEGCGLH